MIYMGMSLILLAQALRFFTLRLVYKKTFDLEDRVIQDSLQLAFTNAMIGRLFVILAALNVYFDGRTGTLALLGLSAVLNFVLIVVNFRYHTRFIRSNRRRKEEVKKSEEEAAARLKKWSEKEKL